MKLLLYSCFLLFFCSEIVDTRFIRPGFFCDSVGTQEIQRRNGVERCACYPGFYGYRCERIFRCVAGRAINVSCLQPPHEFVQNVEDRCIFGQILIEVCDCFPGYAGNRCEKQKYRLRPFDDAKIDPPTYRETMEMERVERMKNIEKIIEEEQERANREYLFQHLRLLLVGFIIFTILCVILLVSYLYFAKRDRKYYERMMQQRGLHRTTKMADAPPPYNDSQFHLLNEAPPIYSDAAAPSSLSVEATPTLVEPRIAAEATPTSLVTRIAAVDNHAAAKKKHSNLKVERSRTQPSIHV